MPGSDNMFTLCPAPLTGGTARPLQRRACSAPLVIQNFSVPDSALPTTSSATPTPTSCQISSESTGIATSTQPSEPKSSQTCSGLDSVETAAEALKADPGVDATEAVKVVEAVPGKRRASEMEGIEAALSDSDLTHESLRLWDSIYGSMPESVAASDTSKASKPSIDTDHKLEGWGIYIDDTDMPWKLQEHVNRVVFKLGGRLTSPSLARLADDAYGTRNMKKAGIIDIIQDNVLFNSEKEDGEDHITVLKDAHFDREWLPSPPFTDTIQKFGRLKQPRPDTCINYILGSNADKARPVSKRPLSRIQEYKATKYGPTRRVDF
jgi:hypothetical protein